MKILVSAALTAVLTAFAALSWSAELPFNQTQFDAAQAAGKPMAVVIHADCAAPAARKRRS